VTFNFPRILLVVFTIGAVALAALWVIEVFFTS
jgi:hypothetical protein